MNYYTPISTTSGAWTSGTTGISGNTTITYVTDSGTEAGIKFKQNERKEIGATLYLKYVKSKLGKVQQAKVKRRLAKLQKLVAYSKEMGQRALYEELCNEVAVLVREAEAVAYGIDTWIDFAHIDKYLDKVRDKTIKWLPIEKFPRVIPKPIQTQLKRIQKAEIFDEYWVLFLDYTKQDLKTTKEKIRDKDPILFGKFAHQKDRYYFIADWVDEYCDLTLDKFIDSFKGEDVEGQIEDLTPDRWKGIVKEVKDRMTALDSANAQNFRKLMEEEEEKRKVKELPTAEEYFEEAAKSGVDKPEPTPVKKNWFRKLWAYNDSNR